MVFWLGLLLAVTLSLTRLAAWPFPFVNVNRYSPAVLTLAAAVAVAFGIDRFARSPRWLRWLCVFATCAVPIAGGVFLSYQVGRSDVLDRELLHHALVLTGTPLLGLVATMAVLHVIAPRVDLPRVAPPLLATMIVAEDTFLARYGLPLSLDAWRVAPYVMLILGGVLLALRRKAAAGIAFAAGLVIFVSAWLSLSQNLHFPNPPRLTASVIQFLQQWGAQGGTRTRFLSGRGVLDPDTNTPYGIDSFADRSPITQLSLEGYLYEFLRPSVLH